MITDIIFKKQQSITSYTIEELEKMYMEGRVELRETNKLQVRQIRRYILDNAHEERIYFPPIVAYKKDGKLFIIDGTQRIRAFIQLYELIFKGIKSDNHQEVKNATRLMEMMKDTQIAIQIFEGLSEKEANQMYVDFNTKGKKVALSKRIAFDSRNEINKITNMVLHNNTMLRVAGVETEKRAVIRPANKKFISLSQLRQIISIFLTGKIMNGHEDKNMELSLQIDEYLELIHIWFNELFDLYPADTIGDYEESMLASFPLLLATVMYALTGVEELPYQERKSLIVSRMRGLNGVDWSRTNPIWMNFEGSKRGAYKYFYLDSNKKNIDRMTEWLKQEGR
ncbi:DNA sulfur modification protein DndB [Lederbergia citrea]|uniref:Uncharacterized protein n=1 Tax=Lederbergia citrea TaxID=2833581 RepID=A0A942UPT8_9BACI|nr:DNA sulfur modification protein DndB [Lederbergia citrea]MBS4223337.1 hypothetical protein [Lederbergia citrea]